MRKILLSIGILATSMMSFAQIPGMIADYNFNACNAVDGISPKANGTILQASFGNDRFSNIASSVAYSGSGGISYGAPSKLLFSTGFTISAWINCNTVGGQQAIVSKWASSTSTDQYIFMVNNGFLTLAVGNPSHSAGGHTGTHSLSGSSWYHVVATWDTSGTHEIYVDGTLDLSVVDTNFRTINSTSATNLYFGCQSGSSRFFNGRIDDVKFFDRKLNSSEIAILKNESDWNTESSLVSKFTFDNGNQLDEKNNNDPIITGYNATTDRFGNASSALAINPTTSYLNFNDSYDGFSTLNAGRATYSFWINFNAVASAYQMVLAKSADGGCSGNDRQFLLRLNPSNKFELAVYSTASAGNYIVMETSPVITAGSWYHVVLTYDGSQSGTSKYSLYLNNTNYSFTQTNLLGAGMNNGPQDAMACLAVGAYLQSNGTFCQNVQRLDAKFDNFYVYSRILNATEVSGLYNEPDPATIGLSNHSKEAKHNVYPNPFNDQLNLILDNKGMQTKIKLLSIEGKEIASYSTDQNSYQINTTELTQGMYFVAITTSEGTTVKKMIKQ